MFNNNMSDNNMSSNNMSNSSNKKFKKAMKKIFSKIFINIKNTIENIVMNCPDYPDYTQTSEDICIGIKKIVLEEIKKMEKQMKYSFPIQYHNWYNTKRNFLPIIKVKDFWEKISSEPFGIMNSSINKLLFDSYEPNNINFGDANNNLKNIFKCQLEIEFSKISWLDTRALVCYYIEKNHVSVEKFNSTLKNLFEDQKYRLFQLVFEMIQNEIHNTKIIMSKILSIFDIFSDELIDKWLYTLDKFDFQESFFKYDAIFKNWFYTFNSNLQMTNEHFWTCYFGKNNTQTQHILNIVLDSIRKFSYLDIAKHIFFCLRENKTHSHLLTDTKYEHITYLILVNMKKNLESKETLTSFQKLFKYDYVSRFICGYITKDYDEDIDDKI